MSQNQAGVQNQPNSSEFRNAERLYKKTTFPEPEMEHVHMKANIYTFPRIPGLILLKGHVPLLIQRSLVEMCLEVCKEPNLTNLDAHFMLPSAGIWAAARDNPCQTINVRTFAQSQNNESEQVSNTKELDGTIESDTLQYKMDRQPNFAQPKSNLQNTSKLIIDPPTDSKRTSTPQNAKKVMKRLRWCTMGYQYNWTKKTYFRDRNRIFLVTQLNFQNIWIILPVKLSIMSLQSQATPYLYGNLKRESLITTTQETH